MKVTEADMLGASLLIVDDQASNVALLEQMLAQAGYKHVNSSMNPFEVRALHRRHRFDLILLDMQMPGMDGFAVIEGLRANNADSYASVLVATAHLAQSLRAPQAGARDFIGTPFDLIEVKARIRTLLEVRLLYKKLERNAEDLKATVRARTAGLRDGEAHYRSLTELATDWYREQDEEGSFTKVSGSVLERSGPVLELLDIRVGTLADSQAAASANGWNEAERELLQFIITARKPFLDFALNRLNPDASEQQFEVSGEPMFDEGCRFIGYRGVGVERRAQASHS